MKQLLDDARFYSGLTQAGDERRFFPLLSALLHNKGLWLLALHRVSRLAAQRRNRRWPIWWILRLLAGLGNYFNAVVSKSQIPSDCAIDGPVYLPNGGYLICGARRIGAGTIIHDHCTLGQAVARGDDGRPQIGDNVWIGPNCVIAGPITIGDGATVLPNSFLTLDVAPNFVVKGNPARIIVRAFDNTDLRRSLSVVDNIPARQS
jgi:serine acetyltransferase